MRLIFLLSLAFNLAGTRTTPKVAPHRFHVSFSRMAIDGQTAVCRIRFFADDLEEAIQQFHKKPAFKLSPTPESDTLFTAYLNKKFVLKTKGKQIKGEVVSSGEEGEGKETMWWYAVQYEAPAPLKSFKLTNTLLFELFDDQKNIFKVRTFPSEKSQSFYFTDGAEVYTVSF